VTNAIEVISEEGKKMKGEEQRVFVIVLTLMISCGSWSVPVASAYAFNEIVPDVRNQ